MKRRSRYKRRISRRIKTNIIYYPMALVLRMIWGRDWKDVLINKTSFQKLVLEDQQRIRSTYQWYIEE